MRRFLIPLLLAACSDTSIVVGDLQEIAQLPAIPNRNLDILFVVDNSQSMLVNQAALTASFPHMMDVLSELDGGLPNLHIGVVTSDMGTSSASGPPAPPVGTPDAGGCAGVGDDGALQFAGAPTLTGAFISDVSDDAGGRIRNYTGELREVFGQIATIGESGCGFEQHLAATSRAFTNPANAGFLRPDANLAVVIIADEDDCSALAPGLFDPSTSPYGALTSFRCTEYGLTCETAVGIVGPKTGCAPRIDSPIIADVQPFVDALVALKGDPRKVLVSAIVGDPSPVEVVASADPFPLSLDRSCMRGADAGAFPAVRLSAFLDAFPGRSQLTSICSDDLTAPLTLIGSSAKKLIGDPCLDASSLLDSVASEPGVQPSCEVSDVRDSAPAQARGLLHCATGAADCFEIVADAAACPATPDHLRVRIQRSAAVAADTWTHVRCQVQAD